MKSEKSCDSSLNETVFSSGWRSDPWVTEHMSLGAWVQYPFVDGLCK